MRVTDKMVFDTANERSIAARERLQKSVAEVSSGKRLQHPADDPAGAGFVASAKVAQSRFSAIEQTVGRAADELNVAEQAMREMGNVITRARELATQLSNVTYSADDRRASAAEVDGLFRNMVALLNTEMGGRYLFGGFRDDAPPFQADGTYVGDAGVRKVEIAPGVYEPASLRADVAVKGSGGGVDVLVALQDFATALRANDVTGVESGLDAFDRGLRQVSEASTSAGGSLTIFQSAEQAARVGRDNSQAQVAGIAEVDFIEAASRMQLANRALEASIAATAQSFRMSLLNRL